MEKSELIDIVKRGESETLEFKKSTGEWKEIIKTVSAFSNIKGGHILIGVSDNGKVIGIQVGKKTIEDLTNKINVDINKVSSKTASLELKDLMQKKLLAVQGKGRSTRYIIKI